MFADVWNDGEDRCPEGWEIPNAASPIGPSALAEPAMTAATCLIRADCARIPP